MNILIIGKGGREHALGWKISSSPLCKNVFFLPGNGGTNYIGRNLEGDYSDFDYVKEVIKKNDIDVVVIGPEEPIANGITDYLSSINIQVIAPTKNVSFLESSKIMAKNFMKKYNIPTAEFHSFHLFKDAIQYIKRINNWPIVIKADGLCGGKGVVIARDIEEAGNTLSEFMEKGKFGNASKRVVIEEYLNGYEFSVFAFVDGERYVILGDAIDYKPLLDGDKGPNTGGMGCVAPCIFLTDEMKKVVKERIVERTIFGLKEEGYIYKGFLYFGLIWTQKGPFVLEYNVRMGDPETQALVKADKRDWLSIFLDPALFDNSWPRFNKICIVVVLVSKGYPQVYDKGFEITGLDGIEEVMVFHAGTILRDGKIVTSGGRVLNVVHCGKTLDEAREVVYKEVRKINFVNKFYRTDIGEGKRWEGIL